jgi:hypothetical protein
MATPLKAGGQTRDDKAPDDKGNVALLCARLYRESPHLYTYAGLAEEHGISVDRVKRAVRHLREGKLESAIGRNGRPPALERDVLGTLAKQVHLHQTLNNPICKRELLIEIKSRGKDAHGKAISSKTAYNTLAKLGLEECQPRIVEKQHHATLTEDQHTRHVNAIREIYSEHPNLVREPYRIFNLDETPLITDYKTLAKNGRKVMVLAGTARDSVVAPGTTGPGSHITAVYCLGADGYHGPRLYIMKGKIEPDVMEPTSEGYLPWMMGRNYFSAANNFFIRCTPSGFIDQAIFEEYLQLVVNAIRNRSLARTGKILITLDGPRVHSLTPKVQEIIRKNDILLHYFSANTSLATQPLDCGVYGEHKKKFRHMVENLASCAKEGSFRMATDDLMGYTEIAVQTTISTRTLGLMTESRVLTNKAIVWIAESAMRQVSLAVISAAFRDANVFPPPPPSASASHLTVKGGAGTAAEVARAMISGKPITSPMGRFDGGGSVRIHDRELVDDIRTTVSSNQPADMILSTVVERMVKGPGQNPNQTFLRKMVSEQAEFAAKLVLLARENKKKKTGVGALLLSAKDLTSGKTWDAVTVSQLGAKRAQQDLEAHEEKTSKKRVTLDKRVASLEAKAQAPKARAATRAKAATALEKAVAERDKHVMKFEASQRMLRRQLKTANRRLRQSRGEAVSDSDGSGGDEDGDDGGAADGDDDGDDISEEEPKSDDDNDEDDDNDNEEH